MNCTHRTAFEVTKDLDISIRADCIIGVGATKGAANLSDRLKSHLLRGGRVLMKIIVEREVFELFASGNPSLTFADAGEIVVRKTTYVDGRTVGVSATAAATDLPESMVRALKSGADIVLEVYTT